MMMNEFGTPMNEAELSMHPNPGKAFIQEQIATSGMEMSFDITGGMVTGAIGIGMGIIGGNQSAAAAAEAARARNRQAFKQYQYDLDMWDAKRSQLDADRMESFDRIMMQARNEGQVRAYKDAANEQQLSLIHI